VGADLPDPQRVAAPVLDLGAQRDGSVTLQELHSTARAYRTQAEIFPDMGHNMMLEPGWAAVAERIHTWLETPDTAKQLPQPGWADGTL